MSKADTKYARYDELDKKAVVLTMVSVLISMFMGALDQTIVATAMPTIVKSLHAFSGYSGVISAYLIASTVALPIGGKLSDVYGRKRFLIGGMLWFTLASALCGFSQSITQLIFFRAMKGIGTGIMQSSGNTTIADLYPPTERGKIIGIASSLSVLANIVGPLLGGYLTDGPGWRYVFFINVPIGLMGAVVAFRYFPDVRKAIVKNFKIDYAGAAALIASVVALLLAFHNIGDKEDFASFSVAGYLAIGFIFAVVFFWIETKASHPLVPLHIFREPIISWSLLAAGSSMAAMFGITIFVPLFLQSVLHTSARESGAILIPLMVTFAIVGTISGTLIGKLGRYKPMAIIGSIIMCGGVFMLSRMSSDSTYTSVVFSTVLSGLGLAVCMPVYNIAVQNAAKLEVLGVATSMVYFTRSMFASIGVAVYGMILASKTQSAGISPALSGVFLADLGFVIITLIASIFLKEIPLRRSNAVQTKPAQPTPSK